MIIQNHTKSSISMMITKLDQHSIILKKSWMKKHDVIYHDHDDSISFYLDHCSHLDVFERFYSNQSQIKKKDFFSKRIFFNQSKMKIEDKEIVGSSQLVTRNVVTVNYVDAWVRWWMIFIKWLHNILYKWFSISSHVKYFAHMLNIRFVT
jgi:hypothetical protein